MWGNVRVTPIVTVMAFETDVTCREMATLKAFYAAHEELETA